MNDLLEVKYAKQLILEILREEARLAQDDLTSRFLEAASKAVDPFTNPFSFFTISLCDDGGDRLSQWRAYGTDSSGYSIGFRADLLPDDERRLHLVKVIYEPAKQIAIIRAGVRRMCTYLRENSAPHKQGNVIDPLEWLPKLLCIDFFLYLISFKDPAFGEEEWRLTTWIHSTEGVGEVEFRTSGKFIVPYVPLDVCERA